MFHAMVSVRDLDRKKKHSYKVTNWSEYNKSLKRRGQLSLYFPFGDLKSQFIHEDCYEKGLSGRQSYYQKAYVELIYLFYRLFDWGMREILGYFEDLWNSKGFDIKVPSFGHLSDLFSSLSLKVKHFCEDVSGRMKKKESVSLIMDSSGFSFSKAKSWYEKHKGLTPDRRPWRKLHLSMDAGMEVHEVKLTEETVGDREMMNALIPDSLPIDKILADGGYYDAEKTQNFYNQGILPVISSPISSRERKNEAKYSWHNSLVRYIKKKGTIHAFYTKYGYRTRSKIESQFSRIKRCLGPSLKAIKISSQEAEVVIIANSLNLWNSFGKPMTVNTL